MRTPARLPPWLDRAFKNPITAAAALTLGVKMGHEVSRLRAEDIDTRQFKQEMGKHIGAVSGTTIGLAAGWFVGRLLPGVGNIVGAFAGGLLGELLGEKVGRQSIERLQRSSKDEADLNASEGPSPSNQETGSPTNEDEKDEA